MSGHGSAAVEKHIRIYKMVFGTLAIMTVVTVACSYMQVPVWLGIVIGLSIAAFKGSLVGAFFMHLVWEKKMIGWILLLTFFFCGAMMGLILWSKADTVAYHGVL